MLVCLYLFDFVNVRVQFVVNEWIVVLLRNILLFRI